jgi:hypothetical protein
MSATRKTAAAAFWAEIVGAQVVLLAGIRRRNHTITVCDGAVVGNSAPDKPTRSRVHPALVVVAGAISITGKSADPRAPNGPPEGQGSSRSAMEAATRATAASAAGIAPPIVMKP